MSLRVRSSPGGEPQLIGGVANLRCSRTWPYARLNCANPKTAPTVPYSRAEYPFASSMEGGAGAHTMWVPRKDNDQQGEKMSAFYRNNQIQSGDNYVVEVIP